MNSFLCIIVNSLRMRLVFPLLNFTCTWLNQKVKRRQKYWMCVLRNGAIRNHGHPPLNIGGGHGLTVRIRVTRFIYLCYCVSRAARTCSDRLPFYPVWRREQHAGITNRAAIYIYKSDCAHTHTHWWINAPRLTLIPSDAEGYFGIINSPHIDWAMLVVMVPCSRASSSSCLSYHALRLDRWTSAESLLGDSLEHRTMRGFHWLTRLVHVQELTHIGR